MVYSKTIMILGDTDINYNVSKEYNDDGFICFTIIANGEDIISMTEYDEKHIAKALSELANGY